ncbi:hypothetical protein IscW_ISCW013182, partial [Ixodes scapularis]
GPHLRPPSPGPLPRAVAVRRRSRRQRRSRRAHHGTHGGRDEGTDGTRTRGSENSTTLEGRQHHRGHSTNNTPTGARANPNSGTVRRRLRRRTGPASSARLALNERPAGRGAEGGTVGGGTDPPSSFRAARAENASATSQATPRRGGRGRPWDGADAALVALVERSHNVGAPTPRRRRPRSRGPLPPLSMGTLLEIGFVSLRSSGGTSSRKFSDQPLRKKRMGHEDT